VLVARGPGGWAPASSAVRPSNAGGIPLAGVPFTVLVVGVGILIHDLARRAEASMHQRRALAGEGKW
jgi:hypothetical protein